MTRSAPKVAAKTRSGTAEEGGDVDGDPASALEIVGAKRNGGDLGVASAAVFLAQGGPDPRPGPFPPRVGPHRNFAANRGSGNAHGVKSLREQEVRNEFVVAIHFQIAEIEK